MASKHDILTEEELSTFHIRSLAWECLERLQGERGRSDAPRPVRVLDWGCGRGRTVMKLLEAGYHAEGVDIDEAVLRNGFALMRERGYEPEKYLRPVTDSYLLADESFDMVLSEQVLEHVEDLEATVAEMARLTAPGGLGVHVFPGSRRVVEPHLHMPLVHWLPKNRLRKAAIRACLAFGAGPSAAGFREAVGLTTSAKVDLFYHYLDRKTYYRSVDEIVRVFEAFGLEADAECQTAQKAPRGTPGALKRNGFPRGAIIVRTQKRADRRR